MAIRVAQIIGFRLRVTPEAYVGRVFGAVRVFVLSGIGPSVIAFGWLSDHVVVSIAVAVLAFCYLLVAAGASLAPVIRNEAR